MTGLLEIIEPPPFEAAPYGLLSLRDPDVTAEERWLNGFTYESRSCTATVNLLDICGGAAPVEVITPSVVPASRVFQPFIIEAVDRCTTFGFGARDVEKRALDALEACTQKALENEFWTGNLAQANTYSDNRYLAHPDTVILAGAGAPVKIRFGLALLERALADCGCGTRGTIHVTRDVGSVLANRVVGEHLETNLGNYLVAGSGYPGTGPDGTAPASGTWMYATGEVSVLLGPGDAVGRNIGEQVNRSNNTWEARAQRPAAVTWDGCCAFAVRVDLALDYS